MQLYRGGSLPIPSQSGRSMSLVHFIISGIGQVRQQMTRAAVGTSEAV